MKWMRRLLWALGGLLLLWAAAWLAVPPLLKWQAEQRLSELLGREVTVGAVSFHPWSLQLTVNELVIAAAPGAQASEPQFVDSELQRPRVKADGADRDFAAEQFAEPLLGLPLQQWRHGQPGGRPQQQQATECPQQTSHPPHSELLCRAE